MGTARRIVVALAGATALGMSTVGCTSSGQGAPTTSAASGTTAPPGGDLGALLPTASPEFVGQSAARTAATNTGRLSLELQIEDTGVLDGVLLTADGAFVLDDHASELEVTPGTIGEQGGMTSSRTVAQGSDVYVRDEAVTAALGVETPWVRYLDECGDDGLGQGLVPFVGADAIGLLDAVEAAGAEVTEVGEEKVAGFPAVHFRSEVDLSEAVAAASPDCRGEWEPFAGSSVPVDIWIHTESGQVMREVLTFDLLDFLERTDPTSAEDLAGVGGTIRYAVEFFDLGEPISISIPADEEVTEITREEYEQVTVDDGGGTDPGTGAGAGSTTTDPIALAPETTAPRRPTTEW